MKVFIILVAINVLIFPSLAFGYSIPKGFESDFEFKERFVKIRNLDGSLSSPIKFFGNYESVEVKEEGAISELSAILKGNHISEFYIKKIITDMMLGVKDSGLCIGKVDACKIYPEEYHLHYNFNEQEIIIFVNQNILEYEEQVKTEIYHSPISLNNGLINSFDLYASSSGSDSLEVSLNDKAYLGLPYGYVTVDVNLNNSLDDNFKVYEFGYNLDVNSNVLKIGQFKYQPNMNSTDFLNGVTDREQLSLNIGSSKNLLVGGPRGEKKLYFFAPVTGSVKIYRNGRAIYQSTVEEGNNVISYRDLPYGRYEAKLELESLGTTVSTQLYQIYNTDKDELIVNDFDYAISAGLLLNNFTDESNELSDNLAFGKGLISYQLFNSTMLGAGVTITQEGESANIGIQHDWLTLRLSSELLYKHYDSASYFETSVNLFGANFSYREFSNNGNKLALLDYGKLDYTKASFSYNYRIGASESLYTNYTRLKYGKSKSNNDKSLNYFSIGYNRPFIASSTLDFSVDYTEDNNELSFNLSWKVPLSGTVKFISGVKTNKENISQFSTSIRKDKLFETENTVSSIEVSNIYNAYNGSMTHDARLINQFNNEYIRSNVSLYGSNAERKIGFAANLSNTQLFTANGVNFTNKPASSYAVIEIDSLEKENGEKGFLSVGNESENSSSKKMIYAESSVSALKPYGFYKVNFDAESVDMYNSGESKVEMFSHPGSVAVMKPKVRKVISFISSFYDLFESPVESLDCYGEGCLSVVEIMDGVYKVSVLEGFGFKIESTSMNCIIPKEIDGNMNLGKNYCLPFINEGSPIEVIELAKNGRKLIFLGLFDKYRGADVEKEINALKNAGYEVIEKDIGDDFSALYISQNKNSMEDLLVKNSKQLREIMLLSNRRFGKENVNFKLVNSPM
ncbi:TcfC E-set like domain-containing protein [Vibrio vulnificus]|uniref:TcfC E-set like domain-containing protein n=1 Tax=Vibrio vulnificus TaxID=672 RepID=UPI001A331DB7|nr:hypothetical protein [Vibrio vulnificus]HAS6222316.1 hypothetical protein [Vibrio vulnificus]